eukprot:2126302-Prorocentrum_lima.AAC.1
MARPELLPKNAPKGFDTQGRWNMGAQMEERKNKRGSRSTVLGPYRQSQTRRKRIQRHAGAHQ